MLGLTSLGAVNTAGGIDCEQSLFFFRFSDGSARARESSREQRDERNEGGIPRKKENHSVFLPLPSSAFISRAWSFACLARFARWTKKREAARNLPGVYAGIIYYLVIYSYSERLCMRIDRQ